MFLRDFNQFLTFCSLMVGIVLSLLSPFCQSAQKKYFVVRPAEVVFMGSDNNDPLSISRLVRIEDVSTETIISAVSENIARKSSVLLDYQQEEMSDSLLSSIDINLLVLRGIVITPEGKRCAVVEFGGKVINLFEGYVIGSSNAKITSITDTGFSLVQTVKMKNDRLKDLVTVFDLYETPDAEKQTGGSANSIGLSVAE